MAVSIALLGLTAQGANAAAPAAQPAQPMVDLALVLAVDVSVSIDWAEAQLQRKGLADGFVSPEVVRAIQAGANGRIGAAVVFFSSYERGVMSVPVKWTTIRDEASARLFANAILAAPPIAGRGTSISDALTLSMEVFETMPLRATKRVIDVSGDGLNSAGPPLSGVRDEVLARDISINGLPISEDFAGGELEQYFKSCVIGGRGSFMLPAKGFTDFARAIRRKLVLEISGLTPEELAPEETLEAPRIIKAAAQNAPLRPPVPRAGPQTELPFAGTCDYPMFRRGFGRF